MKQSEPKNKFDAYLMKKGITSGYFSDLAKVSLSAVSLWRQGRGRPKDKIKLQIEKLTNGKVRPQDWY